VLPCPYITLAAYVHNLPLCVHTDHSIHHDDPVPRQLLNYITAQACTPTIHAKASVFT
jgi:hypothetical protein